MARSNSELFSFPDPETAGPDGLLAVGGNLAPQTLVTAYTNGIFPWYGEGQPILWWSPDPRCVLYPGEIHISRSLRKRMRRDEYQVTVDSAFEKVIRACSAQRPGKLDNGSWITPEMEAAYIGLYRIGIAHSVECWRGRLLVGGLYGLSIGRIFFGESMFSHQSDTSKIALVHLCRHLASNSMHLIDCQVSSEHIHSMGAKMIPRSEFLKIIRADTHKTEPDRMWQAGPVSPPGAGAVR